MPSFIKIVQAIRKSNSISRARLNSRRRPILCTTLYRTLCKRATSVAYLTNFSFAIEFFSQIFTEDASLFLLYHSAKKSRMTKNSNQGGGVLPFNKRVILLLTRHFNSQTWPSLLQVHHMSKLPEQTPSWSAYLYLRLCKLLYALPCKFLCMKPKSAFL